MFSKLKKKSNQSKSDAPHQTAYSALYKAFFSKDEKGNYSNPFKRLPLSIKITGWYSIFLLLMLLMLSVFILQFTQLWEDSEMRSTLQSRVINSADNLSRFRPFQDGVFTVIYTENGVAVKGAIPDGFPPESMLSPHHISEVTVRNSTFYYYDSPISDPAFHGWVRGILPATSVSRTTNIMLISLLLGGMTFLIVGAVGGYWLIKRGLGPIRLLTKTASDIGKEQDLSKRIKPPIETYDEISSLARTFNSMLASLENSSVREKQFSSDVSHELRTPIAVIQAESDYGRSYIASIEEAKESFEHIFQQSRFMTAMVTQLLDIARLDNMESIKKEPLSMSQLMEDVAKSYVRICEDKNIKLTTNIEPNLSLIGNLPFLKRAVGNLIDNAIKFTNDSISLQLVKEDDRIKVLVTDNGAGISQDDLNKIWDRLYQVDPSRTKSSEQGLGLGLYFVHNIVKLHNAKATATSIPGESTSFILDFPAADA